MSPKAIIFCDIFNSVAYKQEHGSAIANARIAERLQKLFEYIQQAAPSAFIQRSEGDSILVIADNLMASYKVLVEAQAVWKIFKTGTPAVCISFGYGEFVVDQDGTLHGIEIDTASRVLKSCYPAGVDVTDSASRKLVDEGLRYKLHRCEAEMKGLGRVVFWKTNGSYEFVERRAKPKQGVFRTAFGASNAIDAIKVSGIALLTALLFKYLP